MHVRARTVARHAAPGGAADLATPPQRHPQGHHALVVARSGPPGPPRSTGSTAIVWSVPLASAFATALRRDRPDWGELPADLDAAWAWMQARGQTLADGTSVAAYARRQQHGPVFELVVGGAGYVAPGAPGHARLLPVATTSGAGDVAALWRDGDAVRVVLLGSDGRTGILADDARAFLALLAIGYPEIDDVSLGAPPDHEDDDGDEAAPLRAWVRAQGIEVPDVWPAMRADAFSAWLEDPATHHAQEAVDGTPTASSDASAPAGIVFDVLPLLGAPFTDDVAARLGSIVGMPVSADLAATQRAIGERGLSLDVQQGTLQKVRFSMEEPYVYPHADRLIAGVAADASLDDVRSVLGKPKRRGKVWLQYDLDGTPLHVQSSFDEGPTLVVVG